jgi:peptidyl-prolyl cis-trans isomerase D
MLKFMRENTGSWIIKILLGLIVLVFVFLGMGSLGSRQGDEVATVNDQQITIDEYQRSYQNITEQMRQRFGDNLNDEILEMLQVKKQALERLIDERLISSEADRLKISVSNKELADSLLGIPAFKRDGVFDLATYRAVLAQNRMHPETFEAMQKEALRQQKVQELVMSTVSASNQEAEAWYVHDKTKVNVDYLVFDPETYKQATFDDKELADYYEANRENYKSEPELTVKYLEFATGDYQNQVTISDQEIKAYYEENLARYEVPEKVEARHILIRVPEDADEAAVESAKKEAETVQKKALGGEDFSELAKTFSQGPTKDSGGYLGAFSRDTMVKPFADVAFSMEAGEISQPVKTQFGWHVIKLEAKLPASTTPLDEVRADIRKTITQTEVRNLAYADAGKAFDGIIDGDDLEQAGLVTGREVLIAGPFTAMGNGISLSNNKGFAQAAFSLDMNKIGDIKEIGGNYYIIKPVEKIESQVLAFEDVREILIEDFTAKKSQERAGAEAEKALKELKDGKELKALASEEGLIPMESSFFVRGEDTDEFGPNSQITTKAFELTPERQLYPDVIKGNKKFYLISLKEQRLPETSEIKENLEQVKESVTRLKQNRVYGEWLAQLRTDAKIDIRKGFLD